jgi:hypothetical protein
MIPLNSKQRIVFKEVCKINTADMEVRMDSYLPIGQNSSIITMEKAFYKRCNAPLKY